MAEPQTGVALKDIQRIVQQIAESFQPQKVILFGSYAYGKATEDSDVDLLVVMETDENPLYAAARIAAAIDHPFPLDILVLRPEDWEEYLSEKTVFVTDVATNGVILYEARNLGMD